MSWSLTRHPSRPPRPPAPRFRPTVRLLDGRRFRGIYFNGTTDGAAPYFYFTINPRLASLSLPLTLWQEIQADRVPALDREKENFYPRPGRERECLEAIFHPGINRWPGSSPPTSLKAHKRPFLTLTSSLK